MDNIEELIKTWNKAQNILIVPNTVNNLDILFSALSFLCIKDGSKKISILSTPLAKSKVWQNKLGSSLKKSILDELKQEIAISINTQLVNPDDLKIQKTDDGFKVVLDTSKNPSRDKIKPLIHNTNDLFDLAVVIGSTSLDLNVDDMAKKVLFITNQPSLVRTQINKKHVYKGDKKAFFYKTYKLFHELGVILNTKGYTFLLAGLISYTNLLSSHMSKSSINMISELIEKKASFNKAYDMSKNRLTINKLKFLCHILSLVENIQNGIYGYRIDYHELIDSIEPQHLLSATEIYDCKIAFAFIDRNDFNQIYIKSNDSNLKLKHFLKEFEGKGNNQSGIIFTEMAYNDFLVQLIQFIDQQNSY